MKERRPLELVDMFITDDDGNIVQWGRLQAVVLEEMKKAGKPVHEGVADGDTQVFNHQTGKLNKKPPPPKPLAGQRAQDYPSVGQHLSVMVEALRAIRDGKPLPPEVTDLIEQVDAVKGKFPK